MTASPYDLRSHAVPLFEGSASRRHHRKSVRRLRLEAELLRLRGGVRTTEARSFVQFLGFPRSGHSLIGGLLGLHPKALVSHELDACGLVLKGMPARCVYNLIADNARQFWKNGAYWNGYRYAVADEVPRAPQVIGDKKGDWAVRWFLERPDLLDVLDRQIPLQKKWVLVTRHPADNIATLSIRRGGQYDRLRIANDRGDGFEAALKAAQADGRVPAACDDEMIEDYERLCVGIQTLIEKIGPEGVHHVVYEDLTQASAEGLRAVHRFCDLPPEAELSQLAASAVKPASSSARRVSWRTDQLQAVQDMIGRYSFLRPYADH
jgi:hypothetical protein